MSVYVTHRLWLCFYFKSGAQKEEESGSKKGADHEGTTEKKAEEA